MDLFARQGTKRSDTRRYREHLQRRLADKDAVLCAVMGGGAVHQYAASEAFVLAERRRYSLTQNRETRSELVAGGRAGVTTAFSA
jgi:hypothetical protein